MAFEIVHSREKEKWQLPFMGQRNRKRKYRFPNYDQYDRRETLNTFLQPSFLNGNDEKITLRKCWKIQRLLNLLLPNTTIKGINDPKPQYLMENPNSFSLIFKDKYNFNERNPKTRRFLDIGRYRLERDFRKKSKKKRKN